MAGQQLGDIAISGGQPDHQVLGGDEFVVHLDSQVLGGGDRGQGLPGQLGLRCGPTARRQPVDESLGLGTDHRRVDSDGFEGWRGDAVGLREQGQQQMCRSDLRVCRPALAACNADVSAAWVLVVGLNESTTSISFRSKACRVLQRHQG